MLSRKARLAVTTALTVTIGAPAAVAQERPQECTQLEQVSAEAPDRLFEAAPDDRADYARIVESGEAAQCNDALSVLRTTAARCLSVMRRLRPGRGASFSIPGNPCAA